MNIFNYTYVAPIAQQVYISFFYNSLLPLCFANVPTNFERVSESKRNSFSSLSPKHRPWGKASNYGLEIGE